jgi:hypothetical protein
MIGQLANQCKIAFDLYSWQQVVVKFGACQLVMRRSCRDNGHGLSAQSQHAYELIITQKIQLCLGAQILVCFDDALYLNKCASNLS